MSEPHMRAADSDRTAVATALGRHMADGRLTVEEYEERVARAYAARTYAELAELTADLPSGTTRPATRPATPPASTPTGRCDSPWRLGYHRSAWGSWARVALIVTAVWLFTSLSSGQLLFFWPMWVVGPWGFVLLSRTFGGPRHHRHYPGRRLPG